MKKVKTTSYKCESCGTIHNNSFEITKCSMCKKQDMCDHCLITLAQLGLESEFVELLQGEHGINEICDDCGCSIEYLIGEAQQNITKEIKKIIKDLRKKNKINQ